MAFDLSIAPKWLGRYHIMDTAHADQLNVAAAINEAHFGMKRPEAEEKAYKDYKHEQLVEAAAHHLSGMKASHAAGNMEAAHKHGLMYGLALRQLGHKDLVNPPDEVAQHAKNTPSEDIARFKGHRADAFSLAAPGDKSDSYRNERDVKMGLKKSEEAPDYSEYPPDHKLGMEVPKGGSSCASCSFVSEDGKHCGNEVFQKWEGSDVLPKPADEYCCDLYKIRDKKTD